MLNDAVMFLEASQSKGPWQFHGEEQEGYQAGATDVRISKIPSLTNKISLIGEFFIQSLLMKQY